MYLLKYLPNRYGATYPSVCKTLLRPKIGYDLKIICTRFKVNVIHPDQDPVSKSQGVTPLILAMMVFAGH